MFSDDTLKRAAHRPVANNHPADLGTADNWKSPAVGQTGDWITGEGIFIRVPLMVSDGDAIKLIENGKREHSAGYTCDLDGIPIRIAIMFRSAGTDEVTKAVRRQTNGSIDRSQRKVKADDDYLDPIEIDRAASLVLQA